MKVILRRDHENLGKMGETVNVKNGYARNYLFPKNIAIEASPKAVRILEEDKKLLKRREEKAKQEAEVTAKQMESVSVTATVPVGEEDKVFGSVTSQQIADLLKEKGFEIDKKKVLLDDPIKALGVYDVPIKLHAEVEGKIRLWVVKE
ncbi:MAG TPA: 50S ribosomal protein L9 [bacterium]